VRVEQDDGVRLHALLWEDADGAADIDVLLVHGLASNALLWAGVAEVLHAAGHRVVAVDQRAHGSSDPSDELGWVRLTADLVAVAQALELDQPLAVGQSWGGNVVLELGLRHPDAIRGIAGVDGGAIELSASFADWEACWAALAPPPWEGVAWSDVERSVRARVAGWPEGSAEAFLANLVRRPDGTAAAVLTRERHRHILRDLWAQHPSASWADLEVPALLVPSFDGGAADEPKRAAMLLAEEHARRLRVHPVDPADHDVHLEQPEVVANALLRAIGEGHFSSDVDLST
jgi:pimeloyl-ACP methyl ester carboxylesterase